MTAQQAEAKARKIYNEYNQTTTDPATGPGGQHVRDLPINEEWAVSISFGDVDNERFGWLIRYNRLDNGGFSDSEAQQVQCLD